MALTGIVHLLVIRALNKNIVIIDLIMMSYETEFNYIVPGEFECDSIMYVNPEAPNIMAFRIQLFSSQV